MKKLQFALIGLLINGLAFSQQTLKYDYSIYKYLQLPNHSNEQLSVLVKGNAQLIKSKTIELGGTIKIAAGDIVSIYIPQNKLSVLMECNFIERVESRPSHMIALNDTMRVRNNVQEVHDGISPLTQPYKGTGVVCGFIDTGIDFTHPDFKNANGTTRVAWIWDHAKPVAPNTPSPYGYGQEWSAADIDAGNCTHVDPAWHYGHGTLSAGISAGNGLSTGFNQGVAPEADIIMVAYDFNTQQPNRIADAVDYIFSKAALMGKPCVINASLGDYYGSHDGRDLEAQMIDNLILAQSGRAMCAAAGNDGNDSIHLKTITTATDTTWSWFKFDPAYGIVYIELWADTADFSNVKFAIGVDSTTTSASFIGRTVFKKISNTLGISTLNFIPGLPGDSVIYYGDVAAGRYQLIIQIKTSHPNYFWRLMTTGAGKFDIWHIVFQSFTSGIIKQNLPPASIVPDIVHYVLPDRLSTVINSYGCSDNVITVGNYYNRNSSYDCSDTLRFLPSGPAQTLAGNSGTGPTRDGRQKPDISATGNYIMAPLVLALDTPTALTNKQVNQGCYHKVAGGTSAAAPVATGVGALYFQKNPTANHNNFKTALLCAAKQDIYTGSALPDYFWGYGKVDAFHTLAGCFSGMNELHNQVQISVYPNPLTDVSEVNLFYQNLNPSNIQLTLYDLLGRDVLHLNKTDFVITSSKAQTHINKNQLQPGMYFYEVRFDDYVSGQGKLIVK